MIINHNCCIKLAPLVIFIYDARSHIHQIYFNIILLFTPVSSKWSLSLRFLHQNPVCTSPLPHTSYVPCPSHFSWFDHPNCIWWGLQIMLCLITVGICDWAAWWTFGGWIRALSILAVGSFQVVPVSLPPDQGSAQVLAGRSSGQPNFVWLAPMFVSPLYRSCFVSPFWRLELCYVSLILFFWGGGDLWTPALEGHPSFQQRTPSPVYNLWKCISTAVWPSCYGVEWNTTNGFTI